MTDQAQRIAEKACAQLADHMRDFFANVEPYAQQYTKACLEGRRGAPRCTGMHAQLQRLVRECVEDELMFERRLRSAA